MSESGTGIIFTQSGVPVRDSADYQRVYDSRWRFMEVEFDRTFTVNLPSLPAIAASARYDERTNIIRHGLGFVPAFESDFKNQTASSHPAGFAELWADSQYVYIQRFVTTNGADSQSLTIKIRLYNLPILTDYVAPKGLPQGTQSPKSNIGVKMLDSAGAGVNIGDNAPTGFSVDTTKKILSIHRHGLAKINDWVGRYCFAGSIDLTSNILTIYSDPNASSVTVKDITWAKIPGTAVSYLPADFATFPGGLTSGTYYVIPVDDTHIKLATSYDNALLGVAIDITSGGSLPGRITQQAMPGTNQNAIFHDVGYPPSFLLAPTNTEVFVNGAVTIAEPSIGRFMDIVLARMSADTRYLYFTGVQTTFSGRFGYVILKDPAELAR